MPYMQSSPDRMHRKCGRPSFFFKKKNCLFFKEKEENKMNNIPL
jgi:ribosomal protein L37E